ncbi:D-alanyl-D-alanine dipeptidase [Desulfotomaculum sp. 1211_IL3151]|uniref:D-alanyl-D-alanine dipeptidase n=1 Tax=Desulfotomaculum sp. 1211_IL3151 TaxID=3084055 RepID=UPI002FD982F3
MKAKYIFMVALVFFLVAVLPGTDRLYYQPSFKLFLGGNATQSDSARNSGDFNNDLVKLKELDDSFVYDLKYASTDNFTGKKIYSHAICLIHRNTAQKLISANNDFKQLGYRIKIYDAYRPYSAQRILYDAAENKNFLADPEKGSNHNRGAAVDITLVDKYGHELPMPSNFDEFSIRSRINYYRTEKERISNRELLGRIMVKHGFKRIGNEWWHFEDTESKQYPLLDIPFEAYAP